MTGLRLKSWYYLVVVCALVVAPLAASRATDSTSSAIADSASTEGMPAAADKEAWLMLKNAHESRQVMPADFKGFDAKVTFC